MARARVANRRLVRAYESGISLRQLAERVGLGRPALRKALLRAGVTLRSRPRMPTDARWWRAQVKAGREPGEIADEFGVTVDAVRLRLRRAGLPRSAPAPFENWLSDRTRRDGPCLRWTGTHTSNGYPVTHTAGHRELAHRAV